MSVTTFMHFALSTLLPVIASVVLFGWEQRGLPITRDKRRWDVVVGVIFGAIAIFGTEMGIPYNGATMNVRDAAPLCAGLIFSGWSGILAGIIGGVERWFATAWGAGEFTSLACSMATALMGFLAAILHKYLFDDHRPAWSSGLFIGAVGEVLHLTLIFITNLNEADRAFEVVRVCTGPMILCNSLAVTLAVIIIKRMAGEPLFYRKGDRQITAVIQNKMVIAMFGAFLATSSFTIILQSRLSMLNTASLLSMNIHDVMDEIVAASGDSILKVTKAAANIIDDADELTHEELVELAQNLGVGEINVANNEGIIIASTEPSIVGYDMRSNDLSAEFIALLPGHGKTQVVQQYRPAILNPNHWRKYAGVSLENGFVEVGYDAEQFQDDLLSAVKHSIRYRHVGNNGFLIIDDFEGKLVSSSGKMESTQLTQGLSEFDPSSTPPDEVFETDYFGTPCYGMYAEAEGYHIIALLPKEEAEYSSNVSALLGSFLEVVVSACLFVALYIILHDLVVNNIRKVNSQLGEITEGDLDVVVDVRDTVEFVSLSDDINSTVTVLKHYIKEADTRIDRELGYARAIQRAALPSVFPPYPSHTDFEIFASMRPAKEVGGDFYDFYLLDDDHLAFLIADVSGKGIPGAMFMMRAKTVLRSLINSGLPVEEVFTQANNTLCEGNDSHMFVTAWMGVIDLDSGCVTFSNAGHNPPSLRLGGGSFELLDMRKNLILGCMDGIPYSSGELTLKPGDIIFIYTDGVVEAMNGEEKLYGDERMLAALNAHGNSSMEELCAQVLADVDAYVGEAPQFDDITMLGLRYLGRPKESEAMPSVLTVSAEIASVERVMDFVDKRLEELDCPTKAQVQIDVAVDEILANIVSYAYEGARGMVSVILTPVEDGRAVRISFEDTGVPFDPLLRPAPDTTLPLEKRGIGGYGIFIVRKTMDDVSYQRIGNRNVLTIVKRLR